MQISSKGLAAIVQREGVFLNAYTDTVGVWTIGTGHTSAAGPPKVRPGMTITRAQNDQILLQDLKPIEAQAAQFIKVPVTQNQYDAIISIVFNVGPRFWKSQCIQRLNAGDTKGAANAIMQWSKPPEIIGRRRSEQKQFLTPDSTPVTHTTTTTAVVSATAATAVTAAVASQPHYWHYWPYAAAAAGVGLVGLGIYLYKKGSK